MQLCPVRLISELQDIFAFRFHIQWSSFAQDNRTRLPSSIKSERFAPFIPPKGNGVFLRPLHYTRAESPNYRQLEYRQQLEQHLVCLEHSLPE